MQILCQVIFFNDFIHYNFSDRMRQRQNTVKKIDASLEKFKCKVPECGAELRSDKIKQHYEKRVCFDMFDNLSAIAGDRYVSTDEMRMHTRFFREMGWTSKKKIPLYKEHEVVLSKGLQSINTFMKQRVDSGDNETLSAEKSINVCG